MPEIVLSTLNARYIHASFGLRYLLANLGDLRPRAELAEFEIHQAPVEIVESLLAREPRIIGLGVYIWNVRQTLEVVTLLKQVRPGIRIVLGGPEVSHEWEDQEIVRLADHTLAGEADLELPALCRRLLAPTAAQPREPPSKVIACPIPDLSRVVLPYDLYTDEDLAHRVIYVEASRGCPFTCEFCLSSLDIPVRAFPLEAFLDALSRLLERGARQFKFVDRTFNLNLNVSRSILRFFRERWRRDLFLHFEMIPDRLPDPLREEIRAFPAGALQFEIGIQSLNPKVCARIRRRQDPARTEENLRFLRSETGVHLHLDLIAGLPGETVESFAAGFDRLVAWQPQEIQVGILKRLRGTPISRHDTEWEMRYSPVPPYEILQNRLLDFAMLQRLRRFARYWELVVNSGRFVETAPLLWRDGRSPFHAFLRFSDWLYSRVHRTHALAPDRLAELLFNWLAGECALDTPRVATAIGGDWRRTGRRDLPDWLSTHLRESPPGIAPPSASNAPVTRARRQQRHLAAAERRIEGQEEP